MTLPTLPNWAQGDDLTAAQLVQIKNAIQDGTLDINTGALESTEITQAGEAVVTVPMLLGDIGHGWYRGDRTELDSIEIPTGTGIKLSLNAFKYQEERLTTTQGVTPYWNLSEERIETLATSGEGMLRVSFRAFPEKKDCAFGFYAIIPDPAADEIPGVGPGIVIAAETRSVGKKELRWRTISFTVPFFINPLSRDYGIELYIENDEDSADKAGYIRICEETVTVQQFGGAL